MVQPRIAAAFFTSRWLDSITSSASARREGKSSCSGLTTIRPFGQRERQRRSGSSSGATGTPHASSARLTRTWAEEGDLQVLSLGPALAGFGPDARRGVPEHDRRFNLVAVLSSGARPPRATCLALCGECLRRQVRGMITRAVRHRLCDTLGNRFIHTRASLLCQESAPGTLHQTPCYEQGPLVITHSAELASQRSLRRSPPSTLYRAALPARADRWRRDNRLRRPRTYCCCWCSRVL